MTEGRVTITRQEWEDHQVRKHQVGVRYTPSDDGEAYSLDHVVPMRAPTRGTVQ